MHVLLRAVGGLKERFLYCVKAQFLLFPTNSCIMIQHDKLSTPSGFNGISNSDV